LLLAAMCLGAVAISVLVARWIGGRLAAPIRRLTDTARRMGAGELGARAAPSGIAEVDTLGAALKDSAEQIQRMLTRERAFSTEVSHQLRTPLSGLRLELEEVERAAASGSSPDAETAAIVSRALAEVDRVESTIAEVIGLARDLPALQDVAVAAVLAGVARRWHGPLAAANRPLRLVQDPDVPERIAISPAAITQILDVLLENAKQHGSGAVTVRVSTDGSTVRLNVQDEGQLAVESWILFKNRVVGASHGIGLSYARRLAEAEGARLVLFSATPTTFSLVVSNA
jgi:signal transduction histidine kinase